MARAAILVPGRALDIARRRDPCGSKHVSVFIDQLALLENSRAFGLAAFNLFRDLCRRWLEGPPAVPMRQLLRSLGKQLRTSMISHLPKRTVET